VKVVVVGGGPSGLYFALLLKRRLARAEVHVFEQNPHDATYGFGIVLAERGLKRLQWADPASFEAIMAASFMSRHRIIKHPDETIFVEGGGYGGAIARLRLLEILEEHCISAGVKISYQARVDSISELGDADLVVGADGVNSVVRRQFETEFGTTNWSLTNRLAWYGTAHHFPYPLLSFKKTEFGCFVAAGYAYTERMSTFVPECDAQTWSRSGMERMDEDERRRFTEKLFEEELGGTALISNASAWRSLAVIRNREWCVGSNVLIGDALHSAHPTIGSGTRIAMEDSISLVEALVLHPTSVPKALAAFRLMREPGKQKLVDAAEKSFMWYEGFSQRVTGLGPIEFVFDFLTRTGRVDRSRLEAEYPKFMARYGHRWSGAPGTKARPVANALGPAGRGELQPLQ
jgi:2-polyprenyl-6-methoxyphenol hydroxylase-like FAD-dependent oxidoreductase